MEEFDARVRGWLDEYRSACPDWEGGPDFVPGLWRKIEARRSGLVALRRVAAALVVSAAAAALLMGVVLIPRYQNSVVYSATYVDVLHAAEGIPERAVYQELVYEQEGK
jgi:hypothetical protein